MSLTRITIEQLCNIGRTRVLSYKGRLMVTDHIAHEYLFREPCRIDAFLVLVCLRGRLSYEVNLEQYEMVGSGIVVNMPTNIIQFKGSENLEAYAILFSSDMLDSIPYDLRQLANSYLPIKHYFRARVPLELIEPLIPYYGLMQAYLSRPVLETDSIIGSLFQAFLLSVLSLMRQQQIHELDIDQSANRGSRLLYQRFMDLLAQHHQQERTVQFYADKLCVTPKYLSMAIKEYSGRNPSDWICDYVIAEAKSLLHYSQISIQEVTFRLNFPTQSAFGKFFKQKTGYSPSEYQKGLNMLGRSTNIKA